MKPKVLKTVNSISGGATSNYLYYKYPADYNIFSCVCLEDPLAAPKDKGLLREIKKRLPNFIASAEADITLKNLLDIEQETGNKITWVTGPTFDQVIREHKALPNRTARFCTTEMKLHPIFWFCFNRIFENKNDEIIMRIGFRADEPLRKPRLEVRDLGGLKIFTQTDFKKGNLEPFIKPRRKSSLFYWRKLEFPLMDEGISRGDIMQFWAKKGYIYPVHSNCVGCFHKSPFTIQEQFKNYPNKMGWFKRQEEELGRTFKKEGSYNDFKTLLPPSLFDLNQYTETTACNCTD